MKANKARDTKPELAVRKILWSAGIRGYRINWKKAPGTPDICFPGKRIAIFVNGCFWHRCPKCAASLPKTNAAFWKKKFELNVARDKAKIKALKKLDWLTLTVWECEIKKSHAEVLKRVTNLLVQRVKS
ncbi:MAG: very short patch repair endonuclease [Sideroxydans sp.]|jgi:DNA mismatch endonuclease (patch repair protein)